MTQERLQSLQLSRYTMAWKRTSAYLPMVPHTHGQTRTLWQRIRRLVWKAIHRRLRGPGQ